MALLGPLRERSACGVGFVADLRGNATHETLQRGLHALTALEHRGACATDGISSDGAGVLTDIPFKLLGLERDTLAVATVFLTPDPSIRHRAVNIFEEIFTHHGLKILDYRSVPTRPEILGDEARASLPEILHVTIERPTHCRTRTSFETLLYLAKQSLRARHKAAGIHRGFFFTSLSATTIVYKALTRSADLPAFYPDLTNPEYKTRCAAFHRRFSTNTRTSWDKAQPFRMLSHNGEFNTINANRSWARSRELDLGLPDEGLLTHSGSSDSGNLNEMVEALKHRSTIPFTEDALALLLPPATAKESDYYRFWSRAVEPWDGPALVIYAASDRVGARLDRNGFRPCRWAKSADHFLLASEAGVFGPEDTPYLEKGTLSAGSGLLVNLTTGVVHFRDTSESRENASATFDPRLLRVEPDAVDGTAAAALNPAHAPLFGLTTEELDHILTPMIRDAKEPVGSMGDTAPPAILSTQERSLFDHFYQGFAQVTNPPLDYLRERLVTDLTIFLGKRPNVFSPKELIPPPPAIEEDSPILSLGSLAALTRQTHDADLHPLLRSVTIDSTFPASAGGSALRERLDQLAEDALNAVRRGTSLLILSDRAATPDRPPVPSILALRAIVVELNRRGRRLDASIIVDTGDARTTHQVSALIGFGATAVCPWHALKLARQHTPKSLSDFTPDEREARLLQAYNEGILKVMSKMGISVVRSYQSSKLFTALGLGPKLIQEFFPGLTSPIGGYELDDIAAQRIAQCSQPPALTANGALPSTHLLREHPRAKTGESHEMTSARSRAIARNPDSPDHPPELPLRLRDLLQLRPAGPTLSIEDVEGRAAIARTFSAAAMSYGAISAESQRDLILAMRAVGGRSNSGEGGENPYYELEGITTSIKQIASGRFGVTPEYLANADEFEIKIAQGAKPGEGGQLLAPKVNERIAAARCSSTHIDLISPPPLHDIYSIEDLKELIHELKEHRPEIPVGVKLVAGTGIGTIALGVVKAGADILHISGGSGGTGAATYSSMRHAGLPWELGLNEVHRTLTDNGLRSTVTLRTDGGLATGEDILKASALGADHFAFGKLFLIAEGCVMARICHTNKCPVGIATQDPKFAAKYKGSPAQVILLIERLAEEVRSGLAALGLPDLASLRGHAELLIPDPKHREFTTRRHIDTSLLCAPTTRSQQSTTITPVHRNSLNTRLLNESLPALNNAEPVHLRGRIQSTDRAIPARLSGALAQRTRRARAAALARGIPPKSTQLHLPENTIQIALTGSAGQGFGAFLTPGIALSLLGEANDSVGKSMAGGTIVLRPSDTLPDPAAQAILGNGALYGATGGSLYALGTAGDRFAVRNSGAIAVIEGAGLHACEYMTAGTILILGDVGPNAGAGMTGGVLILPKSAAHQVHGDFLTPHELTQGTATSLATILEDHLRATSSPRAARFLREPALLVEELTLLLPHGTLPSACPLSPTTQSATAAAH